MSTLMLHKFSAQDRFSASIAAFSGPVVIRKRTKSVVVV
jgi:hypothetical protein